MSKNGSITYQIKNELLKKCRFGESRHEAKIRGDANKYIYSFATLQTYQKQLCYMVKWAKANNIKLRSIEDIKLNGDKWLQSCIEEGMSAWTLTTRRAALGKLCGVGYSYFKTPMPTRRRADIKRGRGSSPKRGFSERLNQNQVTFCRCTGVRLHELIALRGRDIVEKDDGVYVHVLSGKGGKERFAKLYGDKEEIQLCINLAKNAGKDHIFPNIKIRANTHGYRADYCRRCYEANKCDLNTLDRKEKYYCRCDKKGIVYDRKALLICSQNLGHNRINIVPSNYLYTD